MTDGAPSSDVHGSSVAAIYVIRAEAETQAYVRLALTRLRAEVDHLVVVRRDAEHEATAAALADIGVDEWADYADGVMSMMSGYKAGVATLADGPWGHVLLTGSHAYGPFVGVQEALTRMGSAALYVSAPHNASLSRRAPVEGLIPRLDYAIITANALSDLSVSSFWRDLKPSPAYWTEFETGAVRLAERLEALSLDTVYSVEPDCLKTAEPAVFEVHTLVEQGAAALPISAFALDPLAADVSAVEVRLAIDMLRERRPEDYAAIVAHILSTQELRAVSTNLDDYRVLSPNAANDGKTEWLFGRVAVFIHAYYVDMMPEFWALITRLPGEFDLFLTTSTVGRKKRIEAFLTEKGFPESRMDVRVVEQNRGRDMSSLFISFRDVILAGRYEVALRLHSKRTPQVSRRVGESFKAHLFENLVHSEGYIRNLYDELEAQPDIGLVIPPAVHIGFGTLGHGWFVNKKPLARLAKQMGLTVPIDEHTPVAPYGTMYWFRTDALRLMFEWPWRWDEYNEEPHHVDGGLAHVQERLIAYCAQHAGYRTLSIMTPDNAARNYAKLEYKMQLMASQLPHGGAVFDRAAVAPGDRRLGARLYDGLAPTYFRVVKRAPWVRRALRPLIHFIERRILGRDP